VRMWAKLALAELEANEKPKERPLDWGIIEGE